MIKIILQSAGNLNKGFFLFTFLIFSCSSKIIYAQGCSDAGFCTINSFKPSIPDSTSNKNEIKIGAIYGDADHSINVIGNNIEYNRIVNDRLVLNIKFTTLSQEGNGIAVFGYSDILLNGNYKLNDHLSFTAGLKLPLTEGNKKDDSLPLPMDYQSSLGTFDLIVGVGYRLKNFQFILAYQQPLTQNKNQFFSEFYPVESELSNFQSTNEFYRRADVLLRVSYPFNLSKAFTITPSLLPIYHINNDRYTGQDGLVRNITGSQGLTLNGNMFIDFHIDKTSALQFIVGAPFVVRDARPDGLTRHFIASLEYEFTF